MKRRIIYCSNSLWNKLKKKVGDQRVSAWFRTKATEEVSK